MACVFTSDCGLLNESTNSGGRRLVELGERLQSRRHVARVAGLAGPAFDFFECAGKGRKLRAGVCMLLARGRGVGGVGGLVERKVSYVAVVLAL